MRIPAYFAPDTTNDAGHEAHTIYIRRGTVDYISRKRNTRGIGQKFETGRKFIVVRIPGTSSKGGGTKDTAACFCCKCSIIVQIGNYKAAFQECRRLQKKFVLRKFALDFYMSVVQCENYFLLLFRRAVDRHIVRKCFRTVLSRKCGSFQSSRTRTALISCLDISSRGPLYPYIPYLFKCGVLIVYYY